MLRKKLRAASGANSAFGKLKFLSLLSTLQMNELMSIFEIHTLLIKKVNTIDDNHVTITFYECY